MTPKQRLARAQLTASAIVLILTIGYCLVQLPRLQDSADHANARAGQLEPQVQVLTVNQQKLIAGLDEANRRLVALGKPPVPTPTVEPAPSAIQPDEFTAEEAAAVRVIVADQIARQKVQITQAEISQIARIAAQLVPKPKDGKIPTAAQLQPIVTATVAAYCVGDKCVGKTGAEGKTGPRGEQGNQGERGPKISDEELLAAAQQALAAYCSLESKPCEGPAGPTGPAGPQGERGRGIASGPTCTGSGPDSYWKTTYTDGSTDTSEGPCRLVAVPSQEKTGN